MRKVWKGLLGFIIAAVSLGFIAVLLLHAAPSPPAAEMQYARESISLAVRNNAETYSKRYITDARIYYDSAMVNWQKENRRFIYFRNYNKVISFAEQAAKKANQAIENSSITSFNLKVKLKQKIDSLNLLVNAITVQFNSYPLQAEIRERISKGKILLKEGEIAYSKAQYLQANRKIIDSEYLLTASYNNARENLKTYFQSYSTWKKWIDKTITDSKKNRNYSLIIDKYSRKCIVYLSGIKKYEFVAELGKNWVGDKRIRGDMATPEGMYKITKKLDGGKTKYYKALLLDYPNEEDKAMFKAEIDRGLLPVSSSIGGLIEIHGNGGKGIDWTEGCISLTDKEMDMVYKIVKVGTPVTIVGSMVDLESVINK